MASSSWEKWGQAEHLFGVPFMENSLGTKQFFDGSGSSQVLKPVIAPTSTMDDDRLPLPLLQESSFVDISRSPELFRAIFDHAPFGIVVGGSDYRFIQMNKVFAEFLGYSQEEQARLLQQDIVTGVEQ